jgi:hypothetical protein
MLRPIKLHIYSKSGEVVTTYIFIGDVDKDVRACINSAQKSISSSCAAKLKKIYGNDWKKILNISSKSGGQRSKSKKTGGEGDDLEEEITLEEINAISNIKNAIEVAEKAVNLSDDDKKQPVKRTIYVYDVNLYPHDNILEFKKKVSLVTGIPIYKQHIWYEFSKKRFNLNYNLFLQDKAVQVSFASSIFSETKKINMEKIEDIPVLIDFYNAKKLLSVKAYDTFSVLDNIVTDLGISDLNLISLDEYVGSRALNKLDKSSMEIVYYGFILLFWPMITYVAWGDYAHNIDTFEKIYPDLSLGIENNRKKFNLEKKITEEAHQLFTDSERKKERAEVEDNLYTGITYSVIQVVSPYTSFILNLRNLFDQTVLNDVVIACKCSILHKGQKILLNKTFKSNTAINSPIPLRCLIIRLKTSVNFIDVYFFMDGNYSIKSKWPEEKLYDFEDIFAEVSKQVNSVIDDINKMSSYVLNSNSCLSKMTNKNSKFTEISVSLIYRNSVKYNEFKALQNILTDFAEGGIINLNQINQADNTMEYYFSKGMYKSDSSRIEKNLVLENYYSFLTNSTVKVKWQQLFVFTRNTIFQYRHGDVRILVAGIKEAEFSIFYMYIIFSLYKMKKQAKPDTNQKTAITQQKRNVKSLKSHDPILYDFKKLYNSPIIYSKICQKPYQPVILDKDVYNSMEKNDRSRAVKYWNFTTNSDAYYYCPNAKYPYIQFTIKKHPNDLCLPCCRKKPITERDNKIKREIFTACMTEHKYSMEKKNLIQDTRYIMNYGKFMTPGRICHLPENSMEPLLYENFSETASGIEPQCEEQNRYFIFGVEQHTENIKNAGYINSLASSFDTDSKSLIQLLLKKMKTDVHKFKILLDGKIIKYFFSMKDLMDNIHEAFLGDLYTREIPWNDIFINLAYHYLNIITVIFVDKSHDYENVKLLIDEKILNQDQINDPNYRTMLVIKKGQSFHPVFFLNPLVFFRTKMITTKLFAHSDNVVKIIQKAVAFDEINKNSASDKRNNITLSVLQSFMESLIGKQYSITLYFVNRNNLCYYVEVTIKKTNRIYFPIKYSPHIVKTIKISNEGYSSKKYKTKLIWLNQFIRDLNHWIAVESEQKGFILENEKKTLPVEKRVNPIYDFVRVQKWLLLSNPYAAKSQNLEKIIGFKHNSINYYHEPISKESALKLTNAPFEQLMYHPDEINDTLQKVPSPVSDNRIKNIAINMYEYHLYELLLLEFTELFNKEKNVTLRHNMKKQILKKIDVDSVDTSDAINKLIIEYFAQFQNESESYIQEDISRITEQINMFVIKHRDKTMLLNSIDSSLYNFDRVKINYLKTLPKSEVVKEIKKIIERIVVVVPEQTINATLSRAEEFPNMLISCQNRQANEVVYCKQSKLLISSKKMDELIEMLASDILNPFKQKWLFNVAFSEKVLSYFRFKRRSSENITIEIQ